MSEPAGGLARRLRRLVKDAEKAGYKLIADSDASAIRILSAEEYRAADDLREAGETVAVHGGCGGAMNPGSLSGHA